MTRRVAAVAALAAALTGILAAPAATTAQPQASSVGRWQDQIVYVLIPHKFFDGDPANDIMRDRYQLPNPNYDGGFLGGDIAGIRQQMAYLKGLGATTILLYPILFNDEQPLLRYLATGYRVKDYRQVDPNFGTNADFTALLADLHSTANGPRINLLLDLPIAMTGLEHPWMTDQAAYPWYFRPWNPVASENIASAPMHLSYGDVDNAFGMGIVNHTKGMATGSSTYAAVRDNVFWLVDHFAIDGFRYDSAQNAYATFWKQLLDEFRARYATTSPRFTQVGEAFVLSPKRSWQVWDYEFMNAHVSNTVGPIQMDGVYDFGLIQMIQDVFAGTRSVADIPGYVDGTATRFEHPERLMASVDNYEDPTFLSVAPATSGKQRLYLALSFLLTMNRVPLLYSGNEFGLDYDQPGALFQPGLDQDFHRRFERLVAIRRAIAAFRRGGLSWLDHTNTILTYDRPYSGRHYLVILNDAPTSQSITIDLGGRGISCDAPTNLLRAGDPSIVVNNPGTANSSLTATMQPWEPKIVRCA